MKELWEQALIGYNLPLTAMFGLVTVFWLLTILGTMDLDFLDFDFDVDSDAADGGGGVLEGLFKCASGPANVPLVWGNGQP